MSKKILFVCTGNTCRSAMAAAIFNDIAVKKNIDVMIDSAGIMAADGEPASENAVKVLSEAGIDLSYHRSKMLSAELIDMADVILTMTNTHKNAILPYAPDKVFTLKEYVGEKGDVADPYGGDESVYRLTAVELNELLIKLAEAVDDNTKNGN